MKIIKNQSGFTLLEMLIVLLIISVLLLLIIPNVIRYQGSIQKKGCQAYVRMVQGQVQGYMLDHDGKIPTVDELIRGGYITEGTCPAGETIQIEKDGTVHAH